MKKYGLKKSTVYRLLAEKEKYTQQEVTFGYINSSWMVFVWTFVHIYGFEPAKMKPNLNWSQLDEEFE